MIVFILGRENHALTTQFPSSCLMCTYFRFPCSRTFCPYPIMNPTLLVSIDPAKASLGRIVTVDELNFCAAHPDYIVARIQLRGRRVPEWK